MQKDRYLTAAQERHAHKGRVYPRPCAAGEHRVALFLRLVKERKVKAVHVDHVHAAVGQQVDAQAVHSVVAVTEHAQAHALQVGNRDARLARQRARARQVDIKRHVDNAELLAGIAPARSRKTRLHYIHLAAKAAHDGFALVVEIAYRHDLESQRWLHLVDARPHRQGLAPRAHHRHAQAHGTAIARRASGTAQRVLGLPHDRARVIHQQCAGRRHLDTRVRAFEQRDAELGLETRHLLDERRGRHAQFCRRP